MNKPIYEKAVLLLNKSQTLALSIIDEEAYPKIYAMEKVISKELKEIMFITKKNSNKVRLLERNNKCCVEVHTEDDMVCLKGQIKIIETETEKKSILPQDYIQRLERSGTENYCILIFYSIQADLYIDGIFDRITF